jgi:hypothetical protein
VSPETLASQLEALADAEDFLARSEEMAAGWIEAGAGMETVEPVLKLMEKHPGLDFGSPGPLVHFVERFNGGGYEAKLIESIERRPTAHTVWMLNRLINGTKAPADRSRLVGVMEGVRHNIQGDQPSQEAAERFLRRLAST